MGLEAWGLVVYLRVVWAKGCGFITGTEAVAGGGLKDQGEAAAMDGAIPAANGAIPPTVGGADRKAASTMEAAVR